MDTWISKAEHAFRTGQPRLAELYMRRGLSESPAGRSWLAWVDFMEALTRARETILTAARAAGLLDDTLTAMDVVLAGPARAAGKP